MARGFSHPTLIENRKIRDKFAYQGDKKTIAIEIQENEEQTLTKTCRRLLLDHRTRLRPFALQ